MDSRCHRCLRRGDGNRNGPGDRAYWDQLGIQGVNWGGQGTAALAAATEQRDFVGTRLHAGIHAMQAGQSGVILAVDNRASEIGTSTGMSVVGRDDLDGLSAILDGSRPVHPPQLPVANIRVLDASLARAGDVERLGDGQGLVPPA